MKKRSWICTVLTQLSLCFAFYLALNLCRTPQNPNNPVKGLYFITVRGGFRPPSQHSHLLKLMEKVAKAYNARFVINISEFGDDDPLMQNLTLHLPSLRVPWYTTRASKGQEGGNFLKHIKMPSGETLDIIGVDTSSLQDLILTGSSSGIGDDQLTWLTDTLQATNSNWRIVIGFHPLIVSMENKEQTEVKQSFQPIADMFIKFGVNAYLSAQPPTSYFRQGGLAYVGIIPQSMKQLSILGPEIGRLDFREEMVNGLLLHRVSSLEIVTYFVSSSAKVVHKCILQENGKAGM